MRLDLALVQRGLVRSRNQAAQQIADGEVKVNSQIVTKASHEVSDKDKVSVVAQKYVARSANKLVQALETFDISVPKNCLDVGASTGGFTQVLLERGAQEVIALDVGTDQLAPEIRQDPRVIELSETNIRDVNPSELPINPTEIGLVVVDLSFISLRLVAEQIKSCAPNAEFVFLIKPQFELQKKDLNRQGVVVDSASRLRGLQSALESLCSAGMRVLGLVESKTVGSTGNIEYLAHLRAGEPSNWQAQVAQLA